MTAALQQLDQGGNGHDSHHKHATKANDEALFKAFQIGLGGQSLINQPGLFVGERFGLLFRHSNAGQALHESMGVEHDACHALSMGFGPGRVKERAA